MQGKLISCGLSYQDAQKKQDNRLVHLFIREKKFTARVFRPLYILRFKQRVILLRKSVWPMREAVNHLLQLDNALISSFSRMYFRDLHGHVVQFMDAIETFRDMLGSMLDIYLSSISNHMNDIMKTLTMIATIFIPLTFIVGVYGMNWEYMPELHYHWGYFICWGGMISIVVFMLRFFHKKKWF